MNKKNSKRNNNNQSNTAQTSFVENGNSYQATGDIHFHQSDISDVSNTQSRIGKFKKLGIIISILVGITVILTFLFDLPQKIQGLLNKEEANILFVSGIIRDRDTDKGIANAWVAADLIPGDTLITTSEGTFEFKVKGKSGQSIRIYTGAKGYKTRNEYHTLPRAISIYLETK